MRGGTARRHADTTDPSLIECDELGRQELTRDQDRMRRELGARARRAPFERHEHLRLEIEKVIRALAQTRIRECLERRGARAHGRTPGEAGTGARVDRGARRGQQLRVIEELEVRRRNLARGGCATATRGRRVHTTLEPRAHRRAGAIERRVLVHDPRPLLADADLGPPYLKRRPDGEPGTRHHSFEGAGWCGCGGLAALCGKLLMRRCDNRYHRASGHRRRGGLC